MGGLYAKYLEDWASFSDEPVVLYNAIKKFGPSGSPSLMEYLLQDPTTAPKYLAVLGHMGTGVAAEERVLPDRGLGLSIYPNPAQGSGVVKLTVGEAAAVEFEAYDVLGRRQGVRPVHVYGGGEHRIDLGSVVPAALPAGVYFVRVRTVGGSAALSATAALTVVLTVVR